MEKIKYLSLFTGIGGFELGIGDKAECIGYSEINKYACQIFDKHFNIKNYGDITKINEKELPDFDLIVGGFPCQSFSIAGKRQGFSDTRGTLFFDIIRIIRKKQPRLLLLENVKGLLSHDQGNTFYTIISTLDELGYDIQWQVLNSKNFGVPQNRERVFIIGHLRGTSRPEVLPIVQGKDDIEAGDQEGQNTASDTITSTYGKRNARGTHIKVKGNLSDKKWAKFNESSRRVYDPSGIAPTIPTGAGGGQTPKIAAQRGRYNAEGKTEQKLEIRKDNISNTLTQVEKDNRVVTGDQIRRLTPKECERLQGFPDDWTKLGRDAQKCGCAVWRCEKSIVNISDSQRYKTLGNAVTVNVVKYIISKLI